MFEGGGTVRPRGAPLADLGTQAGPLGGLFGMLLLLAVLARTVGLGGAGWLVGLASGLTLNASARTCALARSVGEARPGRLGDPRPRDARGGRRRSDRGLVRAGRGDRDARDARVGRARARLRRRLGGAAHGDGVGARREAGRRGRRVPDPRAQRGGRPVRRRLGARDRACPLRIPRGGLEAALAARASAAARLAEDRDGVAGGRAGDRSRRGPADDREPDSSGRRPRDACRVVRP